MNIRLSSLAIVSILLLAPAGAWAQAKERANPPAAVNSGRQALLEKLERIRFETVTYGGLPLSEVIRNLRDEAKKRDPDKRGINFLLNPNPDTDAGTTAAPNPGTPFDPTTGLPIAAAPAEAVDINAIGIKIQPPLTDVRLVDVLDAIVKVADHPIKYTLEDYGVVFSPRASGLPRPEPVSFVFPGGSPSQFLKAVDEQYRVDWMSVAEIPAEMTEVHLPRLRLSPGSLGPVTRHDGPGDDSPLAALVSLYNQLGEQKPGLGHLVVKGDLAKPVVVMFVPDKSVADAQTKLKVKAFSIWGINPMERGKLEEEIEQARHQALNYAYANGRGGTPGLRSLEGMVAIHKDTSLLVATGTDAFVDMVESIVNACLAKERASNVVSPKSLPATPEK